MIAYFWPFAIMKSLKHNNEVTEMHVQDKLLTTGQEVVLPSHRASGFEFVDFELLDAPVYMPSGSVVFVEADVIEAWVMPGVAVRGW